MNRFLNSRSFLVFLIAMTSCSYRSGNNNSIRPILESFEIRKTDNPGIIKTISFEQDKDSTSFNASYLRWIDNDMPDMFVPSFRFTGDRIIINGSDVVSGETAVSFSKDVICTVFSGSEKRNYIISLICPQINSELPVLRVDLNADDIKDKFTWVETRVNLYDTARGETYWDYSGETVCIRGRGNSTWVLPKKPYRLKFSKKISPLNSIETEAKNWTLLAHDMDKSLIRNHLGFCIARDLFADSFVPISFFINVYFKDNYHGIYQLSDHIERGDGRVEIEKLDVKTGDGLDVIAGGYMLESVINIDDPSIHFTTKRGFGFDHKYPKDDDHLDSHYEWIENYVQSAEDALFSDSFTDTESGWRHYFDEQSLMDYIITKEFAGDMDGYISTRLYKRRDSNKIFFGPVWDIDKGWENDNRIPHTDYPPKVSLMIFAGFRMNGTNGVDWFCRFWQDKKLREAVAKRWNQLKDVLVAHVLNEIDRCETAMPKSIQANFEVWKFNYQASEFAPVPSGNYASLLDEMRQMTTYRADLLDQLFQ